LKFEKPFVTIADPRGALPSYDAVILLSPRNAGDGRMAEALKPLLGRIGIETMRRANLMVDRDSDKKTPAEAARWLLGALGPSTSPARIGDERPNGREDGESGNDAAHSGKR
jgi:hypothetical protein